MGSSTCIAVTSPAATSLPHKAENAMQLNCPRSTCRIHRVGNFLRTSVWLVVAAAVFCCAAVQAQSAYAEGNHNTGAPYESGGRHPAERSMSPSSRQPAGAARVSVSERPHREASVDGDFENPLTTVSEMPALLDPIDNEEEQHRSSTSTFSKGSSSRRPSATKTRRCLLRNPWFVAFLVVALIRVGLFFILKLYHRGAAAVPSPTPTLSKSTQTGEHLIEPLNAAEPEALRQPRLDPLAPVMVLLTLGLAVLAYYSLPPSAAPSSLSNVTISQT